MSYNTTDDHLMHLVGISRDQNGNKYYVIKNSWGKVGPYEGFIHMSEAYVRLKTIAIIVHKDALPPRLQRD
jgi:bleomycin hydrolase